MWTFHQSSGLIEDFKAFRYGVSYAGRGEGKNNPIMQDIHGGARWLNGEWAPVDGLTPDDWGPLPCGIYVMNAPVETETHGPYVMWLTPDPANEMFGRSSFGVHGDSIEIPGMASEGCICSPRSVRQTMWMSGDRRLQVIQ